MAFLHNAWYVAAWSHELAETPVARRYLDLPVVLFRDEDGQAFALLDRCPHRFAPLSRGTLIDGNVRCSYHGLSFDRGGTCVGSLHSPVAPKAASVRAFPLEERDNIVWIWMGKPEKADAGTIPVFAHHTAPDFDCLFGVTLAKADYRLLSDNLMDLTHVTTIHADFGGLDYQPKVKTWEDGENIVASFITEQMPNFLSGEGFVHNDDEIRWISPSQHFLQSRISNIDGQGDVLFMPSAHLLTPETATTTHYFWSSATEKRFGFAEEMMRPILIKAFDTEDKQMVEAVQHSMGDADLFDLNPVLLPADAGAIRVRRKLTAQIEAEAGLDA